MKFALLSKPLIPSMAAAKPKKRAVPSPRGSGSVQLLTRRDGSARTWTPELIARTVRVSRCRMKMTRATTADSVMPRMLRMANRPSTPTVAQATLRPSTRLCA
jgi:hypothetical protein